MTINLPEVTNKARATLKVISAVGPLLIAQWEKAATAHAQHQTRLARVEAFKELLIAECRNLADIRKQMLQRYLDATNEDRTRLQSDIEMIEREVRRLGVIQGSFQYLANNDPKDVTDSEGKAVEVVEPAWLDRFNEYAKLQNEVWRQDLLSRALARESLLPGSVGIRALWFIGTVDSDSFHAFAALIDISSRAPRYCVPNHRSLYERVLPTCAIGPKTKLGNILFLLDSLGLFGDIHTSGRELEKDIEFKAAYGDSAFIIRTKQQLQIRGIILTPLGDIISSLYEPKPNELGREVFDNWIKSIGPEIAEVVPVTDVT
ncbi:MAG: DUF2806 domain-containing protein [Sulfuritalea sp.]|jgi:hypothetical protein|nr:DUF2806 domain-containing protein [Sulfuritalea sp.]